MALEQVGVKAVIEGVASFNRGLRDMKREIISVGDAGMTAAERTETFNKTLKITGAALVATAAAAGGLIYSSVKLAARVETLGVVTKTLGRNVGKSEEEIRALEKAIVDQGITLRHARESIALMIQSDIELAKATDLAREAQDAAVIAGINSSEAFERLVNVISSGSVVMARGLGLQVSFEKAYQATAEQLGTTTAALTEEQRVHARTNEVIRAGINIQGAYAEAMKTAGKQVTSIPRDIEAAKLALGEAFLPTYAKVIEKVRDSLATWNNLSDIQKKVASTTIGTVAVFMGLIGVISLVASHVTTAVAAFEKLAVAVAGQGTLVFSANAVLLIYAAALAAVTVAALKLIITINMIKANMQALKEVYAKHNDEMLKLAGSYEEYQKEMTRAGLLVAESILGHHRFTQILKFHGEEAVLAAAGLGMASDAQFNVNKNMERFGEVMGPIRGGLIETRLEFLKTEQGLESFGRTQDELNADLVKLKKTIDLDITEQFKDYKDNVEALNKKIAELAAIKNPTKAQREDLEKTRQELVNTQKQWDMTTSRIIFDLAEQRLSIDGLTSEELRALRKLAGPKGLGLIDQAAVDLLDTIDVLAGGLDQAGDQSDQFADAAVRLQGPMLDASAAADDLGSNIKKIQSKSVTVTTNFVSRYTGGGGSGIIRNVLGFQHGGNPPVGRPSIVGERGPELIVPRGPSTILNSQFLKAIGSLITVMKSAPVMATAPAVAPMVSNSYSNQYFNQIINTQARSEDIVGDFRTLQAMNF